MLKMKIDEPKTFNCFFVYFAHYDDAVWMIFSISSSIGYFLSFYQTLTKQSGLSGDKSLHSLMKVFFSKYLWMDSAIFFIKSVLWLWLLLLTQKFDDLRIFLFGIYYKFLINFYLNAFS